LRLTEIHKDFEVKRTIAIFALRTIGTLAGIVGAVATYSIVTGLFTRGDEVSSAARAAFAVPGLLFSAFFIWIAYVTWFRLSPRAVQQVCGLLGFLVLVTFNSQLPLQPGANTLRWALAGLVLLLVVLVGYKILSRYLSGIIFSTHDLNGVERAA
jgi:hypothetical protein